MFFTHLVLARVDMSVYLPYCTNRFATKRGYMKLTIIQKWKAFWKIDKEDAVLRLKKKRLIYTIASPLVLMLITIMLAFLLLGEREIGYKIIPYEVFLIMSSISLGLFVQMECSCFLREKNERALQKHQTNRAVKFVEEALAISRGLLDADERKTGIRSRETKR